MFWRNIFVFCVFLVLCVTALGYAVISQTDRIDRMDDQVEHTHQIINESQNLSLHVKGMLMEHRGYLLTGDPYLLRQYEERKSLVSQHIATLKELVIDNPSQMSRLEEIQHYVLDLADNIERTTRAYESGDKTDLGDFKQVEQLKDNINRLSSDLLEEEYSLLASRVASVESQRDQYVLTFVVGGTLVVVLLIVLNIFLMQAQMGRGAAERDLKTIENRLRLALEGTNDGIFDWDIHTNKIIYSDQFWRMLGYKVDAFENTYDNYAALIHPDDLEKVETQINNYLKGISSDYAATFRMKHSSGQWVWVSARAKAVYDRDGRPVRVVGAHMDINPIKAYEEQLRDAKNKAEDANQAKSHFLAHMSHEIRTPLTAISGIAEILEKNIESFDPRHQKLIHTLGASTDSLIDLVNDILDFSKIESGQIDLEAEPFALDKLFEQVISIVSVKANEKGLNFTFDYEAVRTLDYTGDKTRMRQILINLIGNAIKFTEQGSVKVKTSGTTWKGGPGMRLDIEDTGIGMTPEQLEVIFDRFRQADSSVSRKYGGSGLGLPISLKLAQLMGGDILVASEPGRGSTFSLILPLSKAISDTAPPSESRSRMGTEKPVAKDRETQNRADSRILLVEDYEGNITMLSYILESMGFSYDVAETGKVALEHYKDGIYDLVLMDIQMPEMDGLTASRKIRALEAEEDRRHVPIIGMTAHATVGDRDKCIDAGMDAYLSKPIIEDDLKENILRLLPQKKRAA